LQRITGASTTDGGKISLFTDRFIITKFKMAQTITIFYPKISEQKSRIKIIATLDFFSCPVLRIYELTIILVNYIVNLGKGHYYENHNVENQKEH
jgi:hypothetical protein